MRSAFRLVARLGPGPHGYAHLSPNNLRDAVAALDSTGSPRGMARKITP